VSWLSRSLLTVLAPVWAIALVLWFTKNPASAIAAPVANFLIAITGLVLGIDLFFRGFGLLARKRLIEETPRSTVRAAAIGQVEVYGKIVGPYTLISPLAEEDCYYYKAIALGASERDQKAMRLAEECLYVPFFVDDGTGRLMVDPRGAEIDLANEAGENGGPLAQPENVNRFVDRHAGVGGGQVVKAEEYCIKPGDALFVMGTLRENRGPQPMRGRDAGGRFELPAEAGCLSAEAADLQRRGELGALGVERRCEQQPAARVAEEFELHPAVVLGKGEGRQPFIISARSQREVVGNLDWKSTTYIWGGPVMALLGAGFLFHLVGWL
jgi:E3 Ubiquitin ligase